MAKQRYRFKGDTSEVKQPWRQQHVGGAERDEEVQDSWSSQCIEIGCMVMPGIQVRNNTAFPNPHIFPLFGTSVFCLCSESYPLQTYKGFLSTLLSSIFPVIWFLYLHIQSNSSFIFLFSITVLCPFFTTQHLESMVQTFYSDFFSPLTLSSTLCNLDFPSETTCLEKVVCDHLLTKSHGLFSVLILFDLCLMVTSIISWQWC